MADDNLTQLTPRDAALEHRQHTTIIRCLYLDRFGNEHMLRSVFDEDPDIVLARRKDIRADYEHWCKSIGGQLLSLTMDVEHVHQSELVAPPLPTTPAKSRHLQSVPTSVDADVDTGPRLYQVRRMMPLPMMREHVRVIGRAKIPALADLPTISFQSQMQH